jgi:hypothetical protein
MKSSLYDFKLDNVHIISVDGFTTKIFEIIDNDKIHVKVDGINVQMTINGELQALAKIPFDNSLITVTNAGADFVVQVPSADQVHWKIVETSQLSLEKVDIKMATSFLNWLIKQSQKIINGLI